MFELTELNELIDGVNRTVFLEHNNKNHRLTDHYLDVPCRFYYGYPSTNMSIEKCRIDTVRSYAHLIDFIIIQL